MPNIYWLQIFYYIFAHSMLLTGVVLFTSSVGIFWPDLQNVVSIVSRMVFYFTPVFWNYQIIPKSIQSYVKLNPLFYIAAGYRDSFFYKTGFWEHPLLSIYFLELGCCFFCC